MRTHKWRLSPPYTLPTPTTYPVGMLLPPTRWCATGLEGLIPQCHSCKYLTQASETLFIFIKPNT